MDIFGASGILAIVIPSIVEGAKRFLKLPNKFAPIVAFLLGIGGGALAYSLGFANDMTMVQAIMVGIGIGGTSTGLYDLQKKMIGG